MDTLDKGTLEKLQSLLEQTTEPGKGPSRKALLEMLDTVDIADDVKENLKAMLTGDVPKVFGGYAGGSLLAILFILLVFALLIQSCKDRWKNIRNRYAKYKKLLSLPSGSEAKKVKEYYLAQHLHFLDRYLKSRPSKSNLQPQCRTDTHTDESELDEESMSPFQPPSHSPSPQAQNHPSPLSSDSNKKSKMPTMKEVNQSAFDYFNRKQQNNEKQPLDTDLAFLQSMLSDMKAMNLVQKRRFKMGVMQLASQILDGNEATSTSEPAYSTLISQNNIATASSIQQPLNSFHNVAPPSTIEQNQKVAPPSTIEQNQKVPPPSTIEQNQNVASPSGQDENTPTFFTLPPYSTITSVSAAHVTNTSLLNEELPLNYTYNFSSLK